LLARRQACMRAHRAAERARARLTASAQAGRSARARVRAWCRFATADGHLSSLFAAASASACGPCFLTAAGCRPIDTKTPR